MHRRFCYLALATTLAVSLLAACAPTAPPDRDWRVVPESITVFDSEDNDAGDEPYVIQLGFRSKLGVPDSTSTSIRSQCRSGRLPAPDSVPSGTTYMIPPGSADIAFPAVKNLDLADLVAGTAPFELIGTFSFVVERDGLTQGCAITDALDNALRPVLRDALALLIANADTPPTQEDLIELLVDNLGNFVAAAGDLVGAVLEGLGNPDDVIGVAAQILLPTAGTLTDLVRSAFALGGLFSPGLEDGFIPIEELPSEIKIRVGTLSPSSTDFRFTTPIADYGFRSTITR